MLQYAVALLSSLAYSSDVLWGKMALDEMPMYIFTFLLAACYAVVGVAMYMFRPGDISSYLAKAANRRFVGFAVAAIVVGTILADIFMWYAIKVSPTRTLPAVVTLVHTAPIFSLLLVYLFYKESIPWKAVVGILMAVAGCMLTVYYS